ncbi:ABC transporter ATP-binding protein [Roseomonas terrae]|jgi:branched-chain amino acid transport system ATP-binding protein|uniref:ABC transporter ATP-binding protein n=1 Tax=Neoroseomonas terrae TaxID=424799 RepID=A0ABS5ECP3_9PROT|nr:ABC transporter ATP-binding protein [Neoroseomonas terrae]MBR0648793.1 ABC transporter ATP-binding protein [Neoroseomonas terrae]
MTLLAAEGLTKRFGGVVAANGVSFALEPGEMLAMIGPNGAGKSTTFNMVGGQLRPDAGRVTLAGQDVTNTPPRALCRLGVGRSFQVAQTFLSFTVVGNVQMALIAHQRQTRQMLSDAAALHRDAALALLDRVGMAAQADRPIGELAYGDVKRVELAIALAGAPRLLLMDEPTAGMAPSERAALMALVAGIARRERIGVLFTEHDMDSVFAHADRILVLVRGEIIARGSPEDVRADPEVQRVYLGQSGTKAAARARRTHG